MPAFIVRRLSAAAAHARRFRKDGSGIAAVEFAFIVPIMLCMFIGVVEMSQAITVDRRVSHIASSTADLIARQRNVTTTILNDYMSIVDNLMAPYADANLKLTVARVGNTKAAPTNNIVCWVYHRNDSAGSAADTSIVKDAPYTVSEDKVLSKETFRQYSFLFSR